MSADPSRLAAELLEVWSAHDLDRLPSFYAENYEGVDVARSTPLRSPKEVRETFAQYVSAFPDLRFTPEQTITQNHRVAVVWTARGTHRGPLMNIPATGRLIQVRGVSVLEVVENKVQRGLHVWDVAGLLRHLGLLPEL